MTKIVSLGAGRMGRGIAHVFAYAGYDVKIVDFKERPARESEVLLADAKGEIKENLDFLISLNVLTKDDAAATSSPEKSYIPLPVLIPRCPSSINLSTIGGAW